MLAVEVAGRSIAYERTGSGPPLVLVHGAVEDHRAWRFQVPDLARGATVVAWDQPGCGASDDADEGVELADLAHALAAVVETVGPAHVLGFSWGGTLVLELWHQRPDLVRSLVLADTYAGWRGSLPPAEVESRMTVAAEIPDLFAGEPSPEAVALLDEMSADARPATTLRTVALMAAADLTHLLPTITVPTLLLWGEQDARSTLTVACQLEAAIPGARLQLLARAGHVANLEQPAAFTAAVRDWVAGH